MENWIKLKRKEKKNGKIKITCPGIVDETVLTIKITKMISIRCCSGGDVI